MKRRRGEESGRAVPGFFFVDDGQVRGLAREVGGQEMGR